MRALRVLVLGLAVLQAGASLAAESDLKAPWKGAVHPFGQVPVGWENVVEDCVVKVYWDVLEKNENQFTYSSIDNFVTTAAGKNCNVFIRLFAGERCPTWLESRVGTVTVTDNWDDKTLDVIQWWKPEVRTAYRRLMQKLAERYDGTNRATNDRILAITMSRCMTVYAEPFNHQLSDPETRVNLKTAGYTSDLDKVCQLETVQDHADFWKRTRSSIAVNPYDVLTTTGGKATDMTWTLKFCDDARAILGDRLLLQNNSIRPLPFGSPTSDMGQLYTKMNELYQAGTTIGFQCAQFQHQDNKWKETLERTVGFGASYVELTDGWTDAATRGVTREELTAFDTVWENMKPPPPSITFTRGAKWNASNTGSAENSGYNANGQGASNSLWIYERTSTGGKLGSANPWYREAGTRLIWDTKNSDWDPDGGTAFYPQVNKDGLAAQSLSSLWQSAPRISWIAPSGGEVTITGNLRVVFFKDTAAKTSEWAIARKTPGGWTELASGTLSLAAGQATNTQITKSVTLSSTAYPGLAAIRVEQGDAIVWSQRAQAAAGDGGFRMMDDELPLKFTPDEEAETAVVGFEEYR